MLSGALQAQEVSYPIGTVIGPDGNNIPTREQQKFMYDWVSRQGLNSIEHEMLPVAGGYLGWGFMSPKAGAMNWLPYDAVVEDAEASNLDVYLEVFTIRDVPVWIGDGSPDVYMHTPLFGKDKLTPIIRDPKLDTSSAPTVTSPVYIAAVDTYVRSIARRFKDRKRVRGYIIAEELGLSGIQTANSYYGIDFSPSMRDLYHARLKERFKTVAAMNQAWGKSGKYKSFEEVVWKSGWSHDPKNFRGEWMEYYQTLQFAFAEHHNRIARAIKEEDPDALIMVSDFQPMVNRVGHGAHAALLTDVDAFAFKSYWNDVRMQMDFCTGITGGDKQVWCSNFSEAATTRGDVQRFIEPKYIRRQFWPAFARGLDGLFLFVWMPQQMEKMSLLAPSADGSLEALPAVETTRTLREFMDDHAKELLTFKPSAPQVVVHDPNLTFIGQHWDFADPNKERDFWFTETPAIQAYQTVMTDLAQLNSPFTITTESTFAARLADPATRVLVLAGSDIIEPDMLTQVEKWITSGKPTVLDERSGKFDLLGREKQSLQKYRSRSNVLTLAGDRWDRDPAQRERLKTFIAKHQPLRYSTATATSPDLLTVDYMTADDGAEMAVITRRGPQGKLQDTMDISLKWTKPHATLQVLDPFATRSQQVATQVPDDKAGPTIKFYGYQDVLLVIGR